MRNGLKDKPACQQVSNRKQASVLANKFNLIGTL